MIIFSGIFALATFRITFTLIVLTKSEMCFGLRKVPTGKYFFS